VSARKVELFVAPSSGAWKSVGTFEIGKEERKEYPLPKGTQAARVKLVVLANHGNAEYTEISELDLFGERTTPAVTRSIAGVYQTNYGPMRFVQDEDRVLGCYDWHDSVGYIQGSASGRVAQVTWSEPQPDNRQGLATFSVGTDGRLWGVWYERGALAGTWEGPRATEDKAPKCVPARKNQVTEALQRSGKAVLYGIRFATASDLPLPESRSTIDELAAALKATPALTVEISGHTDNTASAEHNLDLSNRRARSVVAALVKSGIAEARLRPKGYGLAQPVADNGTAQGRALNRRVEVSVVK
jgi:outer membrane protein OmpA-like peptidoglycan-associated protein